MEQSKYYTPQIEEFRVGFEYEYQSYNDWIKRTLKDFEEIITSIDLHNKFVIPFRVKYLDAKDIESILCTNKEDFHTLFKLRDFNEDELVFQTY